jgi:hypothetical protein
LKEEYVQYYISYTPPDVTGPTVSNTGVNTTSANTNTYICVNATATDPSGISQVWSQITFPNATVLNITLSQDTGIPCAGTASDDWYGAIVNVGSTAGNLTVNTTFANDTLGNLGYQSPWPNLQVNVTSAITISISVSAAISSGIRFGSCGANQNDCPALNNTSGADGGTEYYITLDSSSTDNADIAHRTSTHLCKDGVCTTVIEIGNATAVGNKTSSTGSNLIPGSSVSLTLSYADLSGCSGAYNLTPGQNCWIRYWLDIPASQTVGNYNTTYCYCAYLATESPSICGTC